MHTRFEIIALEGATRDNVINCLKWFHLRLKTAALKKEMNYLCGVEGRVALGYWVMKVVGFNICGQCIEYKNISCCVNFKPLQSVTLRSNKYVFHM